MAANQVGHPCPPAAPGSVEQSCPAGWVPALREHPTARTSPGAHLMSETWGWPDSSALRTASSSLGSASLCTQLPGALAGGSCLACATQALFSWGSCSSVYTSCPEHQLQCPDQSHGCCLPPYLQPTASHPCASSWVSVCLVAVSGCLPITLAVVLAPATVLSSCLSSASVRGAAFPLSGFKL